MTEQNEHRRLDKIAENYSQFDKDAQVNLFRAKTISSFCKNGKILEMGCADGLVTEQLAKRFLDITAIDCSDKLIGRARKKVPTANFIVTLFEDYQTQDRYDTIILGHVLEHVENPVYILKLVQNWLAKKGHIIVTVPNGESIHRRIGLELGMIPGLTDLNENDIAIGHRRVYVVDTLISDIIEAGLEVLHLEGIMLKPLTNTQMSSWSSELLKAFYSLGRKMPPEICGELCAVCVPRSENVK